MALPRSRPSLEQIIAESKAKREMDFHANQALNMAVAEHERQQQAAEEAAVRRGLQLERAPRAQPPMRSASTGQPRVQQLGLAQPGKLHNQDMRRYAAPPSPPPQPTPDQQQMFDDRIDYAREWLSYDEAGNPHLMTRPRSETGIVPMAAAVERGLQIDEQNRLQPKPSKQKPLPRRI